MSDPMASAPRNEPIEALFDGEWLSVEWSNSAWDGSPYGAEGWAEASSGCLMVDLEAWRYPATSGEKRDKWVYAGRRTVPSGVECHVWTCEETGGKWAYSVEQYLLDTLAPRCAICGTSTTGRAQHWECERDLLLTVGVAP